MGWQIRVLFCLFCHSVQSPFCINNTFLTTLHLKIEEMEDKICIVTGGTAGIGQVTASALAQTGARVIIVGRDPVKCKRVVNQIQLDTANHRVEFRVANLASLVAVGKLANDLANSLPRLDVLVNNAGAIFYKRKVSPEGIEMTWSLNHLAYMLFTERLMNPLKAAPAARIVNVSSDAHRGSRIHFDDLEYSQKYSTFGAYGQSKLANVMFTYELARRLTGTAITTNTLHPGFVASGFGKGQGWISWGVDMLSRIAGISVQEGAQTNIFLATSPEVAGVTGKFFYKSREKRSSSASYDTAVAQRLWEVSQHMIDKAVGQV